MPQLLSSLQNSETTPMSRSDVPVATGVVAILYQRQHDVILGEARNQFDSMPPWHIRIGDPLQDAHRAPGFDEPAKQKMAAAVFDEARRYRIRF